jgi:thymidylate kinase
MLKLIVLEGSDGSGKSSIAQKFAEYGYKTTKEPGGNFLPCKLIHKVILWAKKRKLSSVLDFCFWVDHLFHLIYLRTLDGVVICERYYPISSVVYPGKVYKVIFEIKPHKVIYLKVSPEVAANRIANREQAWKNIKDIKKVIEEITYSYEKFFITYGEGYDFETVLADYPEEIVIQQIAEMLD